MRQRTNSNHIIKLIVTFCDFATLNILLYAFYKTDPLGFLPKFFHESIRIVFFVANASMAVSQYFIPTIVHRRTLTYEQVLLRATSMLSLQLILMFIMIRMLSEGGGLFRFMLLFGTIMTLTLYTLRMAERYVINLYRKHGGNTRKAVFIGKDRALAELYDELMRDPTTGYKISGYYSDEKSSKDIVGLKYLGKIEDFIKEAETHNENKTESVIYRLDDVFCSLSHDEAETIRNIMMCCDNHLIHFFYVPRSFGNYHINMRPEQIGYKFIYTNHLEPLAFLDNRMIKRAFDIVVSSIVCLLMLPFIPIIAIIIKLQSPGPIFFTQERTGINGKTFICYKFRSMHINKDADMKQASIDDPRKFAFGKIMRKLNIDEFPQFFNVLKGDMSIVGPRPHMLYHTEIYSQLVDGYMVRHFCKPGITGWAQVTGFRGETKELWQMEERVKRDIWYIENWTPWLDIKIIFMTAFGLIKPDKNAY